MRRQQVEETLHLILVVEMAADIEHQAAPFVTRAVFDLDGRHFPGDAVCFAA